MSGHSFDMFDEQINNEPSTVHNILTIRPTSSSITSQDLFPPSNTEDRFKQNQLIFGKTHYEQDNTIIKSLEEEIVSMKLKMSFVYEKDEEISKLTDENTGLKKQLDVLSTSEQESRSLFIENERLNETLRVLQDKLKLYDDNNLITGDLTDENNKLTDENNKLSDQNNKLSEQNNKLSEQNNKLAKQASGTIDLDKDSGLDRDSGLDKDSDKDEMININIDQLRTILLERLKTKQMDRIDTLIDTYGFKQTNRVKKNIMEQMLEEAIRLD